MIQLELYAARAFTILSVEVEGAPGARLLPARQIAAAATALSLIAGALFVFLLSGVEAQAKGPPGACEDAAQLAVLASPLAPWKGAPLRVVFAVEQPANGELSLIGPDGTVAVKSAERHGGPPYFWFAEVPPCRGNVARDARARRCAGGVQHAHARNRGARRRAAAAARDVGERLARAR